MPGWVLGGLGILAWIWRAVDVWSNLDFLAGRDWMTLMGSLFDALAWPWLSPVLICLGFAWLVVTQRREAHALPSHEQRERGPALARPAQRAAIDALVSASPLQITLITPRPEEVNDIAVRLRVEATTTVAGCTAHLVEFQRIGDGDQSPLPPPVQLGPHDHARDGTVTANRPATWNFLQVEDPHPEAPGGPLVRRHFFVVTVLAGSVGIGDPLREYPVGPGSYIARVELRSDNAAIQPARLDVRVRYTGGMGLSAEPAID